LAPKPEEENPVIQLVRLTTQRRAVGLEIAPPAPIADIPLWSAPPIGATIVVGASQCFDRPSETGARRFLVREIVLDARPGAEHPVTVRVEEVTP